MAANPDVSILAEKRPARVLLAVLMVWACGGHSPPPRRPAPAETSDLDATQPKSQFTWRLPYGIAPPPVPTDNPMSESKVALGRALFFDRRLSVTSDYSCASCHDPARAFSDGRARAEGATGELHPFGAPSLVYAAYAPRLGWASPSLTRLEEQVAIPLLGHDPIELGMGGRESSLLSMLKEDPAYRAAFGSAFPADPTPVRLENLARALSAFERTLPSFSSAYDRWAFLDEREALSSEARLGARLFVSQRIGCARCHQGLLFGEAEGDVTKGAEPAPPSPSVTEAPTSDETAVRFRVPSLRNVAVTAPYLHDGRLATLDEVLGHHAGGGEPQAPLELTSAERAALIALLYSLTDEEFQPPPRPGHN